MTNEELVQTIQDGKTERYGDLWDGVWRLVAKQANQFATRYNERCRQHGVTVEDLIQAGYIAVYAAAQKYDPAREAKFISYLVYYLKLEFGALIGWRNRKRNPLDNAFSLDEPLTNEEGEETSRLDLLPDESAAAAFENADKRIYQEQLRAALDRSIDKLNDERLQSVIRSYYFEGAARKDIAERYGVSVKQILALEQKAMRQMRHSSAVRELRPFLDEVRTAAAYHGTGYGAWKSSGASSVERAAERIERIEREWIKKHGLDPEEAILDITHFEEGNELRKSWNK